MTTYILGGGCFWCLDAIFRRLRGVHSVTSGYAGGTVERPSYFQVTQGATGHAEVTRVAFDETILAPEILLEVFFALHNPTTLNQQGADIGTQYRSIMLYANDAQRHEFEQAKKHAATLWDDTLVTQIAPLEAFYEAESEHQDYSSTNPGSGYCQVVISPKLGAVRKKFSAYFVNE